MELIAKERDRLLQRTARTLGLSGTLLTLISLSFPGVVPFTNFVTTLPLLVILAVCHFMLPRNRPLLWATLAVWVLNLALDLVPGPWRGTRRDGHAMSRR